MAVPTLLWLDGFEHGRGATAPIVADSASGAATVTTPVRTGARALELNPSAGTEQYAYTPGAGSRAVVMAFYIRFASLPAADVQLAHYVAATNTYFYYHQSTGKFAVRDTTSGTLVDDTTTVAVNTWYRVVFESDTSTTTYTTRAKIDTNTEISTAVGGKTAADITAARLGNTSAATFTAYYDDLLISQTDGDYEIMTPWISHQVQSLIPTSDGTHNITTSGDMDSFTTTAFSNSTTNMNTFIGHRPLQVANTAEQVVRQDLNSATTYGEVLFENLTSPGSSVAFAARAYGTHVMSSATGTPTAEARLMLSDSTEVLTTGSISMISDTEDPGTTVTLRKRMTIAPSGGWDNTKVDGLKCRIGFNGIAADVNFIDLMVEVALREEPAATTSLIYPTGMPQALLVQ